VLEVVETSNDSVMQGSSHLSSLQDLLEDTTFDIIGKRKENMNFIKKNLM
ncbi:1001_t:CDS:1, partial [Dentiscutata erythropus]